MSSHDPRVAKPQGLTAKIRTHIPQHRRWMVGALIAMTLLSTLLMSKKDEWGAWATAPWAITAIYAVLLPFIADWINDWRELRAMWSTAHPKHGHLADVKITASESTMLNGLAALTLVVLIPLLLFVDEGNRLMLLGLVGLLIPVFCLELPRVLLFRRSGPNTPAPVIRRLLLKGSLASLLAIALLALAAWHWSGFDAAGVGLSVGLPLVFTLMSVAYHAARYRMASNWQQRVDQEALRANIAEQAREIAEMQLAILQAQIEPHFLYNTLGSVQYLVPRDPSLAVHLLGQLIRYLQQAMPQMRDSRSTLGREMRLADAFLEIARIRMGGRLSISVELAEQANEIEMPPLMLHTLVENALKHGVEPKTGPVSIKVGAELGEQALTVWVQDNGVGLGGAPTAGSGTGLRNIRQRLQALYGEAAQLHIESVPESGVRAALRLPYRSTRLVDGSR